MKNLYFLILFLTIGVLSSCGSEKKPLTLEEETQAWTVFQKKFQEAVVKNSMGDLDKLTVFPLKGNFFSGTKEGFTRASFMKNYGKIFDKSVLENIKKAKPSDWKNGKIEGTEDAKNLGIPVGTSVVTLTLNSTFNEGEENQTESAQIFYFGNVDNEFKWIALFIAG